MILGGNTLPSVFDNERCGQVAKEVIRTKLKISLLNDVSVVAYRIGKKENDLALDNRKIHVRFTNKQQKNGLFSAAKTAQANDLFVSKNLTTTRQKIPSAIRRAKKKFPSIVTGTYTMSGGLYVWIKHTGRATGGTNIRHKIMSHAMLKRFYNDTPLDQVVNDFSD